MISQLSYSARAAQVQEEDNPLKSYLLKLIAAKKTNLCVSADVNSTTSLLRLADEIGDSICILKTHANIIDDFGERTVKGLREISRRKKFLIFEDAKFGDIGHTVQQQYTRGPFAIASWAHLVNAHIFPGPSIITALKAAAATSLDSLRHGVSTEISVGTPTVSSDGEDDEDEDKDSEDYIEGRMRVPSSSSSSSKRKTPSWQPGTGSGIGGSNRKDSIVTNTTIYQTVSLTQQTSGSGSCSSDLSLSPSLSSPAPRPESAAMENLGEPPLARGLLLVAQMSSAGNLMDARYTEACVAAARRHRNFVLGFVAQRDLNANVSDGGGSGGSGSGDDDFVSLAPSGSDELEPGKKQTEGEGDDGLGQRYRSPREVIGRDGCDVIIVGRGIVAAKDRRKEAERYRAEAWKAYQARVG